MASPNRDPGRFHPSRYPTIFVPNEAVPCRSAKTKFIIFRMPGPGSDSGFSILIRTILKSARVPHTHPDPAQTCYRNGNGKTSKTPFEDRNPLLKNHVMFWSRRFLK